MLLTGPEIARQIHAGVITFEPFDPANLGPNSVDVHLDSRLLVYAALPLDPRRDNPTTEIEISSGGLELEPRRLYLGALIERVGSDQHAAMLCGRTGLGRLGLAVHCTCPLIDQGATGHWTVMLSVIEPLVIYPGLAVAQIIFFTTAGAPQLYQGRYQDLTAPAASRLWQDTAKQT